MSDNLSLFELLYFVAFSRWCICTWSAAREDYSGSSKWEPRGVYANPV